MMKIVSATLFLGVVAVHGDQSQDVASLLQQPVLPGRGASEDAPSPDTKAPFKIGLRRESVPVYRKGKVASFKTSYSGVINVGTPAQEFRVVFDTGSGNIVLPAVECQTEACLVEGRRRFDMSASSTAVAVNGDGSLVPEGEESEQVTIGFGTGEITGEFTRDRVCFGSPPASDQKKAIAEEVITDSEADSQAVALADSQAVVPAQAKDEETELCVEMSVVLAIEMSSQPFKTFRFDGILGLGLNGLAMNKQFSAFEMIMGTGLPAGRFGVFLTEGEDGEESEIAMGGADPQRLLEPLSWAPVAMPELGYWQIHIKAVRVNGKLLDVCLDGTCRGVVDTGTSHLGVPAPFDVEMKEMLTREAGDTLDCRLIDAPEVEIELPHYNITLSPANYMRRLPLREGVSVSSAHGVHVPEANNNTPAAATATAANSSANASGLDANASGSVAPAGQLAEQDEAQVRRFCTPRLIPVRLPEPLGPKLFILGEPVLHRYYTVYDWANHQVGFSLANNKRNTMDPAELTDRRGVLPKEVDMLLMQERVKLNRPKKQKSPEGFQEDVVAMVQVKLKVSVRSRRNRF